MVTCRGLPSGVVLESCSLEVKDKTTALQCIKGSGGRKGVEPTDDLAHCSETATPQTRGLVGG